MKVHVVCRGLNENRILTRMAQYLSTENGWTLGTSPRSDVDFNFFAVYIDYAERWHDWHKTMVGAYFSHYETGHPQKEAWWAEAASRVDLCVLTADQYHNRLDGKYYSPVVRPPIDPQFRLGEETGREQRPVVGLAGFVPKNKPNDRKGIGTLKKIRASKTSKKWTFRMVGNGWPETSAWLPWEEMPRFYRGLDVFLCTSEIEGIPMPPLEALACGVPIVVPEGVGMLDELSGPGVFRYRPPNGVTAIQKAIRYRRGPTYRAEDVAHTVKDMRPDDFAADVEQAVRLTFLSGSEKEPESSAHGKRGVYIVAYGEPARKCASHLIDTVREWLPGAEIALASDRPLRGEDHLISLPDVDIGGRAAKTRIASVIPEDWQYVLYLDADTEIVKDVSFLFEVLEDGWDAIICKNPGKYHTIRKMVRIDNKDECEYTYRQLGTDELLQLNGGVFGFQRNPRTIAFFDRWHEEWQRWGKRDQAALLRALFKEPLRLYVLGNEWNTVTRYVENPMEYTAGILHYPMKARRWRGIVDGRLDGEKAWGAVQSFKVKP